MEDGVYHTVEYARSGRSKCRRCRLLIHARALRYGRTKAVDEKACTDWYHFTCLSVAMAQKIGGTVDDLVGFAELEHADQLQVLTKVLDPTHVVGSAQHVEPDITSDAGAAAGVAAAAAALAPKADFDEGGVKLEEGVVKDEEGTVKEEEEEEAPWEQVEPANPLLSKVANPMLQKRADDVYMVQYAASGRAKCAKCKELIAQGSLREGVSYTAAFGEGTSWRHWECMTDQVVRNIGCIGNLKGWDSLEPEDLTRVEATFANPPVLPRINHKKKKQDREAAEREAAAAAIAAGAAEELPKPQDLGSFLTSALAKGYPLAAAFAMAMQQGGALGATDFASLQAPALPAAALAPNPTPALPEGEIAAHVDKAPVGSAAKKPAQKPRKRRAAVASEDEEAGEENGDGSGSASDDEWRPGKRSGGKKKKKAAARRRRVLA